MDHGSGPEFPLGKLGVLRKAAVIQVIRLDMTEGDGEPPSAVRHTAYFYDLDGTFLARQDFFEDRRVRELREYFETKIMEQFPEAAKDWKLKFIPDELPSAANPVPSWRPGMFNPPGTSDPKLFDITKWGMNPERIVARKAAKKRKRGKKK